MMGFLVTSFTSLSDLAEFVPAVEPLHPVEKSEVVPMKLLMKDEKYKQLTFYLSFTKMQAFLVTPRYVH